MSTQHILVLGGTGKTGRRVTDGLRAAGAPVRTAARSGGDVRFDWSDPSTYDGALAGVRAVYLVQPALRLDHAADVATFLDRAEAAGVAHVTLLSARGVDLAPPEAAMRAVELDLIGRAAMTHAILRPAWFMQNLDESFWQPTIAADGVIPAPTGDGAEAFVHADDIAAVAAATLLDPAAHAGAAYVPAGPEALSLGQVAGRVGAALGREVAHVDVERSAWIAGAVQGGLPADYAELLAGLFDIIKDGQGAVPNDDVERVTGRPARSLDEYLAEPAVRAALAAPVAAA